MCARKMEGKQVVFGVVLAGGGGVGGVGGVLVVVWVGGAGG
ncbi:hypothetical protein J2Z84_001707, partial [Agrobacterium rubi]|nr:hypothetical protein [Agrobacterium rubi]